MPLTRRARYLTNAALVLLGVAVGLALAEAAVRVLDPHARDQAMPGGFFAMDTALGWRQLPDHTVTHRTPYFATTYTTNALGHRDREHGSAPPPGSRRVVVFGDSQIFGWGIPIGRRFTDLLQARSPALEVWNAAVMGYGFDQELLAYERSSGPWRPDIVVLFISPYTLERTKSGYLYRKYKPRFLLHGADSLEVVPPARTATTVTDLAYRLLSGWYLPYFVDRRLGPALTRLRTGRPPATATEIRAAQGRPPSPLTAALLARAGAVARSRGQRLILLADLPAAAVEGMRRIGRERGFEVVSMDLPQDRSAMVLGPRDGHWNEGVHERIAGLLGRALGPETVRGAADPESKALRGK